MGQLFTPDDFKDDWYGYLTNQVSHVGLGIFLVWFVCALSYSMFGELPMKWAIFFSISILYFLFEMTFQGWRRFDTIEDTIYVAVYGAGGTVLSFTEFVGGKTLVVFDVFAPILVISTFISHLIIGCVVRWYRSNE
jgi:hypothetical protein